MCISAESSENREPRNAAESATWAEQSEAAEQRASTDK